MADQWSGGAAPFEDFSTFDPERLRKAISGDPASLHRSGDAFEKVRIKLTDAHDRLRRQAGKLQHALQGTSGDHFQSYCDAVLENNERVTAALQDGQYQQTLSHAGSEQQHARTEIAALLVTYAKASLLGVVLMAASGHSSALAAVAGVAEDVAEQNLGKARARLENLAATLQSTGSKLRPLHEVDGDTTTRHSAAAPNPSGTDAGQRQVPNARSYGGARGDQHQDSPPGNHKETEQQKQEQKQQAAQARQGIDQKAPNAVSGLQNNPASLDRGASAGADQSGGHEPGVGQHSVGSQNLQGRVEQDQARPDQGRLHQAQRAQGQQSQAQQSQNADQSAVVQRASRTAQQAGNAMRASLGGAGGGTSEGSSENAGDGVRTRAKSRSSGRSDSPPSPQHGASGGDRPRTQSSGPNDSAADRKTAHEAQQQLQSMRSGPDSGHADANGATAQNHADPLPAAADSAGAGLADFLNPGSGSSPATGGDGGASLAASGEASAPTGGSLDGSAATAGLGADATAPGPQPPVGPQPSGGGGSVATQSGGTGGSGSSMMPPMGGMGAGGGGAGAGNGGGRERQTWLSADDGTWDEESTPGSHVLGRSSENP